MTRLLVIDPAGDAWADTSFAALPGLLAAGDLVVVNDAATLPASLHGRIRDASAALTCVDPLRLTPSGALAEGERVVEGGRPRPSMRPALRAGIARAERERLGASDLEARVELRLVAAPRGRTFAAVLLGAGDWRTRTEDRPAPPAAPAGTQIVLAGGELVVTVVGASPISPRLVWLEASLDGDALWRALYAAGRPVQYAHVPAPYKLWDVQTPYAGRPWAVEMPSAGRPLTWELLGALAARGIRVAALTHAAGLSATGDPAIDRALPLAEAYDLPARTVAAIRETHERGGRVVAIGTSVVRALEGAAVQGALRPGGGVTDLVIGRGFQPQVVDAVVSGIHPAGETHHELLAAFAGDLVGPAMSAAIANGYRPHEQGDATIVLPGALDRLVAAAA